ncbi:HdeD family acid-resistance protein [Microbacterium sp. P04]|uniref:HdeD family acid-resistance protein n=1 Tax=Microbacterium sp. P04 TaxID=3366947 RepID=UPI003746044A
MTSSTMFDRSASTTIRTALGVGGALSIIVGILILVWPGRTAEVATAIIAIWAIVVGLVYVGLGFFTRASGGWSRIGHIVLGVLFVIAGIIALANIPVATVSFALFLGVFVGILWIVEGVVSLSTISGSASKGWTIFYAIISVIAGVTLLFSPLYVALLWLFLGIGLIVLGIVQVVRAFTFARSAV